MIALKITGSTFAACLLCVGHAGAVAADTRQGQAATPVAPVTQLAPAITVLRVGSAETDSVLEVDRSLNAATGGSGTVGSDREGGPGD